MHVFVERTMGASRSRGLELGNLAERAAEFQRGKPPWSSYLWR